jgi:alkylation response protein AidB-like acyl-CoA dehydrogenase
MQRSCFTEEQELFRQAHRCLLPRGVSGECILAIAMSEPVARSDHAGNSEITKELVARSIFGRS